MDFSNALQSSLDQVGAWASTAVEALPRFVAALVVLGLFWFAAALARRVAVKLLDRVSEYKAVNSLLATMIRVAVVAFGLLIALGILNLDRTVTSILAGAGILGLAIGFAAQDMVENLIAGILLSIRRPLRHGDLISSNDTLGVVEEINLRATVIRTPAGQLVYVPNADILDSPLTNYSTLGTRRVDLECGVGYGDDLDAAKAIAVEAIENVSTRDPERDVQLFYKEFGGSSINFTVRFWVPFDASNADYLAAQSEAIMGIKRAFDENGISIPFPIRTLDFGPPGGVPLSEQLAAAG